MSFRSTVLTQDEIKMFRELNISYGKKKVSTDNSIVGTEYNYFFEGVVGLIDRENKIYFLTVVMTHPLPERNYGRLSILCWFHLKWMK